MRIRPFRVFGGWDFIVGQTVLERTFSKLGQVAQARQHDIGSDAVELGRTTGDAIKFLDSQLKCAVILGTASEQRSKSSDLEDGLHSAFSKRVFVADNHRASIILEGRRKNFASRSALPAGQDNQRPGISNARIG